MINRIDQSARMSQAVIYGGTIYLAGQVGAPGDTATEQTRSVLAKIDDLLARAGSGKHLLLSATIWLADMADYDEMNAVWDDWLADVAPPARATSGVGPANPVHKVEIIAVAARESVERL